MSRFIWLFNYIFFPINFAIWVLWNPFRLFAKKNSKALFVLHRILLFSGIKIAWGVFIYIITLPLRFALAIYYDLILYWGLSIEQSMRDFAMPKNWQYRSSGWFKYTIHWVLYFPYRFFIFSLQNIVFIFDGALMAIISTAFPTFTMYHGTSFRGAVPITQRGGWKVGSGNYAGSGLYFGIKRRVAEHYSRKYDEPAIILVRVTLSPTRLGATLHPSVYALVGKMGESGREFSRRVLGFYQSHEHWRDSFRWWEYCLLVPDTGSFVRTWRVRPIAVIERDRKWGFSGLRYIWNGMYHFAYIPSAWAAAFIGLGVLYVVAILLAALGGK